MSLVVRKTYLHLACEGNHLTGIGGPSAPHVFAFDRRQNLPGSFILKSLQSVYLTRWYFLPSSPFASGFQFRHDPGFEDNSGVKTKFWGTRHGANVPQPTDVIMRTKFNLLFWALAATCVVCSELLGFDGRRKKTNKQNLVLCFFDGYLFFLLKVELGHVGFMLGAMLVGGPMALHLQQKDIDRKVDGSTQKTKYYP